MGVKQRKSWEQMSGKDFKLDAENKKGFILFLERGPEEWYNRKKRDREHCVLIPATKLNFKATKNKK